MKPIDANDLRAFIERYTEPDLNTGCWLWTGALSGDGYAALNFVGQPRGAHRASWQAYSGNQIPAGSVIRHSCHTPQCVNPAHLSTGTQKQNMADKASRIVGKGAAPGTYAPVATHCRRGHPFDASNTFIDSRGDRGCKTCRNDRLKEFRQRRKVGKVRP